MFAPKDQPYVEFESSEQINNYLFRDPEVQAHLRKRGGTPMIVMVFFDDETEEICRELGYQLNAVGRAAPPYGDSGKTTFFITGKKDWEKYAEDIIGQQFKVMKRIDNKAARLTTCSGSVTGSLSRGTSGSSRSTYWWIWRRTRCVSGS